MPVEEIELIQDYLLSASINQAAIRDGSTDYEENPDHF